MSGKNIAIVATVLIVGGAGWYAFRPELLFINQKVSESFPVAQAGSDTSQPVALSTGSFHGVEHGTEGTATVYKLPNGNHVLRLTGFKTSNGPDVHLYAVAAQDAKDSAAVKTAGFVDLGKLKGNEGDQNYDLPSDLALDKYRAVTVWCARFGVNFGTAPLLTAKS